MSAALEKPWPICAVCNKPVDELLEWRDHDAMRHWFGVKCHGAFEKSYLNDKELYELRHGGFTFGAAFATKELTP